MAKFSLVFCVLALWVVAAVDSTSPNTAPAPSVDCSTLIFNMADCLSFVSNGSTISKPEGSCCSGLKTVLKANAECLCEAFKSSAQFGVVLNVTKASTLPTVCGVSAPPISKCGISVAPGAAPAKSPKVAPSPKSPSPVLPPAAVPVTPSSGEITAPTPAPAPAQSGAPPAQTSFVTLLVSLVVVSCFYF